MLGVSPPYDKPTSVGIPAETLSTVICLPANDADAVERTLASDPDVAVIILEPGGASNATIPTQPWLFATITRVSDAIWRCPHFR